MDGGSYIVQEAVIKTIPMKKKCKKEKWLSKEASQIAEKRREAKDNGDKERYTHLNGEFQIGRRDKKAFVSEPCTESWPQSEGQGETTFFNFSLNFAIRSS